MTRLWSALALALGTIGVAAAASGPAMMPLAPQYTAPSQVDWKPAGKVFPAGTKMAVLAGDPAKAGFYTIRVMIPDGGVVAPAHWHKMNEYVTVLQGTFLIGMGDTVDKSLTKAMPAGSFIIVPSGLHHYAIAQGDTTIQVSGDGPVTWDDANGHEM
jgi:quercetin dioxygenase-like cupin family protein